MVKFVYAICVCLGLFASSLLADGQAVSASGTIRGSVLDPSGAAIGGATVTIQNPVSQLLRTVTTDAQGNFAFEDVPFDHYHLNVTAPGFNQTEQDVNLRSAVPVQLKITLSLGTQSTTVNVTADAGDLVNTVPAMETNVDRGLMQKLPVESAGSGLGGLLQLSTPGVAADSNGMVHGLGDHAENSYSLDGQPITDQQSKTFSNEIPEGAVASMHVIEGAPPAEYGDKTSLVVVVNTRSGLGVTQPHGSVTASYGSFGTSTGAIDLAYGGQTWGNFISLNATNTGRFLDTPEYQVFHDHGNEENFFDRIDVKPTQADTINLNLWFTRSWFQTPNSYDAQDATAWSGLVVNTGGIGPNGQLVGPTDQRSQIRTFDIAPTWTRLINPHVVFTFGGSARQDQYYYYPSNDPFSDLIPDLQLQTVGQHRTLTDLGLRSDVTYVTGPHTIKIGANYGNTILTERDSFGIVDPTLNAVCLNSDGTPYTGAGVTNPAGCTGPLMPNPGFSPLLACYDLTRTAPLPASDGCPNATSTEYQFYGHADIRTIALYIQDTISMKHWTFNLGMRGDIYRGITKANQAEPRAGIAYNFTRTNSVLRISYARTLETPFNENLVLASEGCANAAVNAIESTTVSPCVTNAPITAGWRNEFHAGLDQAFGKYFVLNAEYIWKYTHGAYDFSALGNTPIAFPIEWAHSKIPGLAVRGTLPNYHGLTAFIVMSHVVARFFEPQIAGIGATPSGGQVFRIDHDEAFNETTHLQYQPIKNGPWIGFSWRYDSGMVAGPVPCAGGECANGPLGTDTVVDVAPLTPDQQFEAGLYCGAVHATPTIPISANDVCRASQYGSTLLSIPAPGTENNDHNPPRVAPRNVFDLAIGDDNLFHTDKYKWSARVEVVNLANNYALYNFLSTFSGTHYLTPRTITATVGLQF